MRDVNYDVLRICVFHPYAMEHGPHFVLSMYDTGRTDRRGQSIIAYRLNMITGPWRLYTDRQRVTLFEAEDFSGSPMHADDSDATVKALMSFLCLRPGDTDADYFASDTEVQREYRETHAEALYAAVCNRFGWED